MSAAQSISLRNRYSFSSVFISKHLSLSLWRKHEHTHPPAPTSQHTTPSGVYSRVHGFIPPAAGSAPRGGEAAGAAGGLRHPGRSAQGISEAGEDLNPGQQLPTRLRPPPPSTDMKSGTRHIWTEPKICLVPSAEHFFFGEAQKWSKCSFRVNWALASNPRPKGTNPALFELLRQFFGNSRVQPGSRLDWIPAQGLADAVFPADLPGP